ncbi:MAG: type VI secretion system tip protein VgrG [Sandaracinaceae bacterium]|nr:type VI secretion system tip protein VgrG [Sandaracinaceae bacterium]
MGIESRVFLESLGAYASAARIHARGALSAPFDVEALFYLDDGELDLDSLLWTNAVAFITNEERGSAQLFHGVIEEADYLRQTHVGHLYRVRLRPRVHELAYRVRTRIFQNLTAVEIVQQVLRDAGVPDDAVQWDLANQYDPREYCTQWNESELAFVSRLLEDEGIFYWFDHAEDGHVMRMADTADAHEAIEGNPVLPMAARLDPMTEQVTDVTWTARVTSDVHTTRDWNWGTPAQPMQSMRESDGSVALERYEYPGHFVTQAEGDARASDRVAAQLVDRYCVTGRASAWALVAGRYFALVNARPDYLVGEYVLTSVEHRFEHGRPANGSPATEAQYVSSFTAMPRDLAYKPPRSTPRPKVYGVESAVVTGPPGEEIHVDAFGRIKVRFYWDREHPVDDTASCWIRVQQLNNAGTMILPRVGWEMGIVFLDGDPDRPVAIHKTYNREEMPPYELPANKTQGSLRSSSSPGGGGTNEIRMQDGNGGMELFMHAQKDYSERVGNDRVEQVTCDVTEQTGTELETSVKGAEDVSVGADQSVTVAGGQNDDTGGSVTLSIGAKDDIGVTGNHTRANDGSRSDTIGAAQLVLANRIAHTANGNWDRTVTAVQLLLAVEDITDATGGTKTELIAGAKIEKIGGAKSENMGAAKALTAGAIKESTSGDIAIAGAALSIAAGGPIQIGAGGAFSFAGKNVTWTSPASATLKAGGCELKLSGGTLNVAGKKLSVSGTAQVTLKGTVKWKKKGGKGGGGGGGGGKGGAGGGAGKASKSNKGKGGKVKKPTKKEQRLAASPGNSPEQIAARKKVAAHHYQTYGKKYDRNTGQVRKLNASEMQSELACIDYNQPVIAGPPPPIPSTLSQYQAPGGRRGGYFAPPGTSPSALGIGANGTDYSQNPPAVVPKTSSDYQMSPQTHYLQSTAAPCNDTWSTKGTPQPAAGGGTQYYVGNGYHANHPQVKPL